MCHSSDLKLHFVFSEQCIITVRKDFVFISIIFESVPVNATDTVNKRIQSLAPDSPLICVKMAGYNEQLYYHA